jgi:delta 1-pyrroline-5-carboxylate dehydrogenase
VLADSIRFWERKAARHLRDERVRGRGPLVWGRKLIVRRRPHGVVGVIAPWNYPLGVAIGDSAPALIPGNAVVIKPSEITPLTTTMVVDDLVRATDLPEDVLLVATGRGETGAALVDHVDMIMCTGSTPTVQLLRRPWLRKAQLERQRTVRDHSGGNGIPRSAWRTERRDRMTARLAQRRAHIGASVARPGEQIGAGSGPRTFGRIPTPHLS